MDNNSIYTEEEQALLNRSGAIRMTIVDNMIKEANGVVVNTSTARVINELLTSTDKKINDAASARLKFQDDSNKEAILATVAETLKAVSANKAAGVVANLELIAEVIDVEVVDGELSIQPDLLEIENFTQD